MTRISKLDVMGIVSVVLLVAGIVTWWAAVSSGFSFSYTTVGGAYQPADSSGSFVSSQPPFVPLGTPAIGGVLYIATTPMVAGLTLATLGAIGTALAVGNRVGRASRPLF
ncbi:hypothetical protein [Herbiconiux sp. A18JL235]|uniref:Uncharacterized protein n=1 Tax=Herbiconiux sp. A18JL235 TaxID=3152363 RepID=A0AB39BCJ6_9MICO